MLVSDIFDIQYGQSLSLNKLHEVPEGSGIAFVSRTAKNNGVSAWVEPVTGIEPFDPGLLTVCLRSRNYTLATFVQPRRFYCGYHIYVLTQKNAMDLREKLWWAECIAANRYRYNFGRQANRTLADLELPDAIPDWVNQIEVPEFTPDNPRVETRTLDTIAWRDFTLGDLFDMHRGRDVLKRSRKPGATAYIGASASDNGITAWIDEEPDYPGGQITLSRHGIGEAFYQPYPFVASSDIVVLDPKSPMSASAALFICTLLSAEKFRWNYGRKWSYPKIAVSNIRLPVTSAGDPDLEFCSAYIDSLPLANTVLPKG